MASQGDYQDLAVVYDVLQKDRDIEAWADYAIRLESLYSRRSGPGQGRGGSGIKTAEITKKTGSLIHASVIDGSKEDQYDLIIMSAKGQAIRLPFKTVSISGRATQGVRLMRFKEDNDHVASVTLINKEIDSD